MADAARLRVDLGPDARLDVALGERRELAAARVRRARRRTGGAGAAPVLAPAPARRPGVASARLGGEEVALDGAPVYAEKNWGAAFADHWWWGQAFPEPDVCVAFAGGRIAWGHGARADGGRRAGRRPRCVAARAAGRADGDAASDGAGGSAARSPRLDGEIEGEAAHAAADAAGAAAGRAGARAALAPACSPGALAVTLRRGRRVRATAASRRSPGSSTARRSGSAGLLRPARRDHERLGADQPLEARRSPSTARAGAARPRRSTGSHARLADQLGRRRRPARPSGANSTRTVPGSSQAAKSSAPSSRG